MGDCYARGTLRRAGSAGVASAFLLGAVAGCYTYVPVEPPGPPAGEEVRIELTGAGQDRLLMDEAIDLEWLDGRLLDGTGEALAVVVHRETRRMDNLGAQDVIDTLRVPRVDVREISLRTFSTSRTVLASALGVAVLAGVWAAFGSGEGGQGDDPPPIQLIGLPLSWAWEGISGLLSGR